MCLDLAIRNVDLSGLRPCAELRCQFVNLPMEDFREQIVSPFGRAQHGVSLFKVNEARDPNEMSEPDKSELFGKNSTFFGYF